MIRWKDKARAAAVHLALSLLVAALAAWLVFALWFPYPYREISGGRELFFLVVSVDVVLGPLITFVIFNRQKSRREMALDFSVVALLQLGALGYGLWTVAQARPVHLVFEYDRFRVVHVVDLPAEMLDKTPPGITALPLAGPTLLSLKPIPPEKSLEITMAAVGGLYEAARPDLWQTYDAGRAAVLKAAKPLAELMRRFPAQSEAIQALARQSGLAPDALSYLPLASRKEPFWTVILDARSAQPVGYLPLDSF